MLHLDVKANNKTCLFTFETFGRVKHITTNKYMYINIHVSPFKPTGFLKRQQ